MNYKMPILLALALALRGAFAATYTTLEYENARETNTLATVRGEIAASKPGNYAAVSNAAMNALVRRFVGTNGGGIVDARNCMIELGPDGGIELGEEGDDIHWTIYGANLYNYNTDEEYYLPRAEGGNKNELAILADVSAVASDVAATIPQMVTNVVRDVQGLVYDEKLGITWKQTMYDGNLYYIAVTNANITEVAQ